MGLSITDLFTPATADQWETKLLQVGTMLGLQTTAWQSGQPVRTIIKIASTVLAGVDQVVSTMAQGGFLDFAAMVTPDPSVDPTVSPGWLDELALSEFNVEREPATFAPGTMSITNGTGSTYGPFPPKSYHVANPTTGKTYANVNTLSIVPGTQSVAFEADVAGADSTSAPGAITQAVTTLVSVTVTNPAAFVGSNAESNSALVTRCRAKLKSLSPNGASGAYEFFALSASELLAALPVPLTLLGGPITRALAVQSLTTGTVTLTLANAGGAPSGTAKNPVTGATNATPIVMSFTNAHECSIGDTVIISGVQGNTAANITGKVGAPVTGTSFALLNLDGTNTTGSGSYTTGGVGELGDVGLVDSIVQANSVPDSVTEATQAAAAHLIAIVVDVWVPSAYAAPVVGVVQSAIAAYFATLPIGGLTVNSPNIVPFDAVLATALKSATYIQQAQLTLNGGTSDITLATSPVPEVAEINGAVSVIVHVV